VLILFGIDGTCILRPVICIFQLVFLRDLMLFHFFIDIIFSDLLSD